MATAPPFAYFNGKFYSRLWAGVMEDFENVLSTFVSKEKDFSYEHFTEACRRRQISLIFHTTIGRGVHRQQHYNTVVRILFDAAKTIWLDTSSSKVELEGLNEELVTRRRLCGFYLLFMLFTRQPMSRRTRIPMTREDYRMAADFIAALETFISQEMYLQVLNRVQLLLEWKAFDDRVIVYERRMEPHARAFLNIRGRERELQLFEGMRDIQNEFFFGGAPLQIKVQLKKLLSVKEQFIENFRKSLDGENVTCNSLQRFIKMNKKSWEDVMKYFMCLNHQSVFSMGNLLGQLGCYETPRNYWQLDCPENLDFGEKRKCRPYVQEGGIFGRKKERTKGGPDSIFPGVEEDDDENEEERAIKPRRGNLWTFLAGSKYKKKGRDDEDHLERRALKKVEREDNDYWSESSEGGTTDGEEELEAIDLWHAKEGPFQPENKKKNKQSSCITIGDDSDHDSDQELSLQYNGSKYWPTGEEGTNDYEEVVYSRFQDLMNEVQIPDRGQGQMQCQNEDCDYVPEEPIEEVVPKPQPKRRGRKPKNYVEMMEQ